MYSRTWSPNHIKYTYLSATCRQLGYISKTLIFLVNNLIHFYVTFLEQPLCSWKCVICWSLLAIMHHSFSVALLWIWWSLCVVSTFYEGGIVNNTLRPPIPKRCDPEWRKLMEDCWCPDPAARPSFTEITNRLRDMSTALQKKRQSPANR